MRNAQNDVKTIPTNSHFRPFILDLHSIPLIHHRSETKIHLDRLDLNERSAQILLSSRGELRFVVFVGDEGRATFSTGRRIVGGSGGREETDYSAAESTMMATSLQSELSAVERISGVNEV